MNRFLSKTQPSAGLNLYFISVELRENYEQEVYWNVRVPFLNLNYLLKSENDITYHFRCVLIHTILFLTITRNRVSEVPQDESSSCIPPARPE